LSNKRGFTLIEMLVAMVIILVALLGLVQAAFLSIDNNLKNLLRDEAVRLAEEQMNVLKSLPINDVPYNPPLFFGLEATHNQDLGTVIRKFGTFPGTYEVYLTINDLTSDHSRKSIQVYVGWNYKNVEPVLQTPTNKEYQYMITSIVANTQ
jgi:prepilin-type N-terminal cleavage/methylation domain-containing protein